MIIVKKGKVSFNIGVTLTERGCSTRYYDLLTKESERGKENRVMGGVKLWYSRYGLIIVGNILERNRVAIELLIVHKCVVPLFDHAITRTVL